MNLPRIAVDAMGGDEGVRVMIEGAALARRRAFDHHAHAFIAAHRICLLYTSPSPRDATLSRMPSSA